MANRRCHGGDGFRQMACCLSKRMHGKSATTVLVMAGDDDPVFDPKAPVIALTHALDAAGHRCKVRQDGAARAAQQRAALDRRERSVRCGCCDPQPHAVDDPRARSFLVVHA